MFRGIVIENETERMRSLGIVFLLAGCEGVASKGEEITEQQDTGSQSEPGNANPDEFVEEDPDHDWDGDGYTENDGDCNDNDKFRSRGRATL